MIIITGSVEIKQANLEDALALSLRHCEHSRSEGGCISHEVTQNVANPCKLFFFERWQDNATVQAHFALDSSQQFVKNLSALCASAPVMEIFEAKKTN